jgi:hypothetical protein
MYDAVVQRMLHAPDDNTYGVVFLKGRLAIAYKALDEVSLTSRWRKPFDHGMKFSIGSSLPGKYPPRPSRRMHLAISDSMTTWLGNNQVKS